VRRALAVVGVEVPPPSHRLVAVDEHSETLALPAVEILHPQLAPVARPRGELVGVGEEERLVDDLDAGEAAERVEAATRAGTQESHRLGPVLADLGAQAGREALRPALIDLEAALAQLGREMAHRRPAGAAAVAAFIGLTGAVAVLSIGDARSFCATVVAWFAASALCLLLSTTFAVVEGRGESFPFC